VESDCQKPCYGREMALSDDPGVCSGSPPVIALHGPRREPWIVGTEHYVWQVIEVLERRGSPAAVAAETGLTEHQVRVALEYYERAPDSIDASLAERREPVRSPRADARGREGLVAVDQPAAGSVRRWLARQLRQPVPFREHLEAAAESDDPEEARRLLARVEFSPAQRRHLDDLLARWAEEARE
jgi:uncharacterized protein (DUF433 family)